MYTKRKHELQHENYGEFMNEGYYEDFCLANERVVENAKDGFEFPRKPFRGKPNFGSYCPIGNDSRANVVCVLSGRTTYVVRVEDQGEIHYELYCFHETFNESKETRFQNLQGGAEILIKVYAIKTYAEALKKHLDYESLYMGEYFKIVFDLKKYIKKDTKNPNFDKLKFFL